jgi:hypothetical protein
MSEVVALHAIEGGYDFDALFESLKGHSYQRVLVIALDGDGAFEWWGNITEAEAFLLMAKAQKELLEVEDD